MQTGSKNTTSPLQRSYINSGTKILVKYILNQCKIVCDHQKIPIVSQKMMITAIKMCAFSDFLKDLQKVLFITLNDDAKALDEDEVLRLLPVAKLLQNTALAETEILENINSNELAQNIVQEHFQIEEHDDDDAHDDDDDDDNFADDDDDKNQKDENQKYVEDNENNKEHLCSCEVCESFSKADKISKTFLENHTNDNILLKSVLKILN
jgi:hypothetical protein